MNKKLLVIVTSLLIVGLAFPATPAWAQEQEDISIGEVSDPGILPDSPFYFAKGWERAIRSFFTFNTQEKAKLALRFANEDTLAIQELCDQGECQIAEKHCEKFQEQFQRAIQWMEEARQEGKDVEELIEKMEENHLRQQQVLAGVLEKAPEQAQEGILNAIANSSVGLENAIERVQGKHNMEQFREELNLQLNNVGEETQLRIQEQLEGKRHKPEEVPVEESQQEEPQQQESSQQNRGGNK